MRPTSIYCWMCVVFCSMDIIVTNIDAIRAHRIARSERPPFRLVQALEQVKTRAFGPRAMLVEKALPLLELLRIKSEGQPLHLRVSKASQRPRFKEVIPHVCSCELPNGSLWKVVPTSLETYAEMSALGLVLYVDGPELCVISRVSELPATRGEVSDAIYPKARAYMLASEFCGTYSLEPTRPETDKPRYGIDPILSPAQLQEFVGRVRSMDGLPCARVVSNLVAARQGSPMESAIYACLTFRPGLGGFNLAKPAVNSPLRLESPKARLLKHKMLTPDFYWELYCLVCEYDGGDHFTANGAREDKRRVLDYQMLGLTVLPITSEDVRDVDALDKLLRRMVEHMAKVDGENLKRRARRMLNGKEYRAKRSYLLSVLKTCV